MSLAPVLALAALRPARLLTRALLTGAQLQPAALRRAVSGRAGGTAGSRLWQRRPMACLQP